MSKIVPFGKYKDKPVDQLIEDKEYCEWLLAQPWFLERYGVIHKLVINYGAEPVDTPEHNAMQARFLDEGLCRKIFNKLYKHNYDKDSEEGVTVYSIFEHRGWDVVIHDGLDGSLACFLEIKPCIGDDYPSVLRQIKKYPVDNKYGNLFCCRIARIIVTDTFNSSSVTYDQVREICRRSGVLFVTYADLLAALER